MAIEAKPPFRFWSFFFSPQGRVSRLTMWVFVVPASLAYLTLSRLLWALSVQHLSDVSVYSAQAGLGFAGLLMFWPLFAAVFKRLHDIQLTGFLALIMLLPQSARAASIALGHLGPVLSVLPECMVWLGFIGLSIVKGTRGPNRYGPDPLGRDSVSDVF